MFVEVLLITLYLSLMFWAPHSTLVPLVQTYSSPLWVQVTMQKRSILVIWLVTKEQQLTVQWCLQRVFKCDGVHACRIS